MSDSSISDSPPVSRSQSQRGDSLNGRRANQNTKSVKRSHLLAALRTLKSDLKDTFPEVDPLREKLPSKQELQAFKRCCSLDLSTHRISSSSCNSSKTRLLTFTLTNSIFRRDWSTAACCVQLMLDMRRCRFFVYRTLLLVLFNHPHTNSAIIDNFMSRVLNLRTRSEQLTFLRQTFLLPDDIEACTRQQDLMSTRMQDEGMTTSEDET